jgi:hypothetical protein
VSTTVNLWREHPLRLGELPIVSAYIQSLLNEDALAGNRPYRYDDTWDTEPLFDLIRGSDAYLLVLDTQRDGFQAGLHLLRDENIALARVTLCCRSHDLYCVSRGVRSDKDCVRFHFAPGSAAAASTAVRGGRPEPPLPKGAPVGPYGITGVSLAFKDPKQRNTMAARSHGYTDWITLDSVPAEPAVCLASRLYLYFRATELMPQADDLLFVTSRPDSKHAGKCWGLGADALANVMGRMMKKAGIPDEFLPHSARHAGLALRKSQGMSDNDVMSRANMGQRTYTLHYARQIRRRVDAADAAAGTS